MSKKKFSLSVDFDRYDDMWGTEVEGTSCCGMFEINGVKNLKEKRKKEQFLYRSIEEGDIHQRGQVVPFLLFSDIYNKGSGGRSLKKFILDNKLGDVITSPVKVNPNTGNKIEVFIWVTDAKAINKWFSNAQDYLSRLENVDVNDDNDY
jgi:hypothetical protein